MLLPTDQDGPAQRNRSGPAIVAIVAAVAAAAVIGYASRPNTVATTVTQPLVVEEPDPIVTTTSSVPTTGTTTLRSIEVSPLTAHLPGVDDFPPMADRILLTVTATDAISHLVSWPSNAPASSSEIPAGAGPVLFFDASDNVMAFLGAPIRRIGLPLYAGDTGAWSPVAYKATSFAWHATWPRRLAWIETGRGLCFADLAQTGDSFGNPNCLPGVTGRLTGFDDHGFALVAGSDVVRLTVDGEEINRVPGSDALIGPDGRVLIEEISDRGGYALAGADLTNRRHLEWTEGVRHGLLAWSPQTSEQHESDRTLRFPQLALLEETSPGRYRLESRDMEGNQAFALDVAGSFTDVRWDRSGRYLLVPGIIAGQNVVLLYDLANQRAKFIGFEDDVLESRLVIPATCEDASFVEQDWESRYGVPLADLWMVSSRDSHLGWTLLSGRIAEGIQKGEIATWVLPWYGGKPSPPPMSTPANDVARDLGEGSPLDLGFFGIDDWMSIDGARISQWCVTTEGG